MDALALSIIITLGVGLLGIAVGGVITWWVSRRYYSKASQDLEQATAELRRILNLITRAMEEGLKVEFARDPVTGEVRGMVVKDKIIIQASAALSAEGTVIPAEPQE